MPKIIDNKFLEGISGKIGNIVVRQRKDGTAVIAKAPSKHQQGLKKTAQNKKLLRSFKKDVRYAKNAIKDPELHEHYSRAAKGSKTVFNIAVKDSAHPPIIEFIQADINKYGVRDKILICASDDFKVNTVKLIITNSKDELIEEGDAVFELNDLWTYTTINRNKIIAGAKILAIATDLPNNKAMLEIVL